MMTEWESIDYLPLCRNAEINIEWTLTCMWSNGMRMEWHKLAVELMKISALCWCNTRAVARHASLRTTYFVSIPVGPPVWPDTFCMHVLTPCLILLFIRPNIQGGGWENLVHVKWHDFEVDWGVCSLLGLSCAWPEITTLIGLDDISLQRFL